MGGGSSIPAPVPGVWDYEDALMADTEARAVVQTETPAENTAPGRTAIYRHATFPDKLVHTIEKKTDRMPSRRPSSRFSAENGGGKKEAGNTFVIGQEHGTETIPGCFFSAAKMYPENDCLGWRWQEAGETAGEEGEFHLEYQWLSYDQTSDRVRHVAAGLSRFFPHGSKIGIYGKNCVDWTVVSLAAYASGMVVVPLYDTLGDEAVEYIIKDAGVTVLVVGEDKKDMIMPVLAKMAPAAAAAGAADAEAKGGVESKAGGTPAGAPQIKQVVVMGRDPLEDIGYMNPETPQEDVLAEWRSVPGIEVCTVKQLDLVGANWVAKAGTSSEKRQDIFPEIKPEDTAIIMYTSGTTGVPKGVVLTQGNVMSSVAGATAVFEFDQEDSHISYLPLAHIFETVVQIAFLVEGASIGFFSGDIKVLFEDIGVLKPTIFVGVPRVFQRLEQRIQQKIAKMNKIKRMVIGKALKEQTARVAQGLPRNPKWDKKVFGKMAEALGGNCRLMLSGSAPLAAK